MQHSLSSIRELREGGGKNRAESRVDFLTCTEYPDSKINGLRDALSVKRHL